ncbi:SAC3/GANP/Nin1/mts3/eIF-3 p25 [Penicillium italicum]|uniref:SAC3/GANP/Nin1/mts3/eIF-3 p25 n=1 Tax=Penicillium italicum TaxID=40296 RepID=A0A0A2KPU5_PENIT|nr:SAC3/GANP/Nin1/mts3/eIF-3 p25 [Penicillium italicum]
MSTAELPIPSSSIALFSFAAVSQTPTRTLHELEQSQSFANTEGDKAVRSLARPVEKKGSSERWDCSKRRRPIQFIPLFAGRMASPFNPSAGRGHRGGAPGVQGSTGRGRGGHTSTYVPRGAGALRAARARGRGRGSVTWTARGRGRGAGAATHTVNESQQPEEGPKPGVVNSPFGQPIQQKPVASPFGAQPAQQSPFSGVSNNASASNVAKNPFAQPTNIMKQQSSAKFVGGGSNIAASMEHASTLNNYQERFDKLKIDQVKQRERAIKDGQMADPNQPTSLKQAITPVGTCTGMCPDFERVERIVQKAVDKCEKYHNPATNQLEIMETKMVKRFRRAAAGNDEQLPSDIRTPKTLLQTMNYLIRYVINGGEPLAVIHMFVWNRTRSIRNDFSVQQLTQVEDVKTAVTCLERIARFHIVSLHLLSNPANTEQFDRHQEREQLNNTMLSLMYYYDDNRERIHFPNEDEFRAYHILFSIHDQRPDLEARVQKWPAALLASPRVQVALELFAAACNTWEPQGALDSRRPNAVAQGFYTRFFNIINSPSVSYLMACVAEVYFNHIRQTAIRAIWKAYCRTPLSQQSKNDHWTVEELTKVLHFDYDEQTIEYCNAQGLHFAENASGGLYLNWGDRPVDSVDFAPSSDHSFSETYVESKRAGRNLVAIILGMNIREAARMGMIDRSQLPQKSETLPEAEAEDGDLFVSDIDNQTPTPVVETPHALLQDTTASEFRIASESQKSLQSTPASSPSLFQSNLPPATSKLPNPFAAPFQPSKTTSPPSNPFATSIPSTTVTPAVPSPFTSSPNPFSFPKEPEKTNASALTTTPSLFQTKLPSSQPDTAVQPAVSSISPAEPSSSAFASTSSSSIFSKPAYAKLTTETPATTPPVSAFPKPSPFPPASSTADKPASIFPNGSSSVLSSGSSPFTAPSLFSFSKPSQPTQKTETPPATTTPAQPTLFKPSTSPNEALAVDKPASVFSSGAGAFTAPSPFSFSKPSEPTQKTEPPAPVPTAPSTLFKPSTSPPASLTEPKNPFAPSTFSGANPFGLTNTSAQSTVFKSDASSQQTTVASNSPLALPNALPSFPAVGLGNAATPAAPFPFQAPKAPETAVKAKEPAPASGFGQPFSSFSVNNASTISGSSNTATSQFPVPGSVFAVPKAPQPSQKVDIPATTAPTPEKPPLGFSPSLGSLQSPKLSETSVFSQSAPAQAQTPVPQPINGSTSISGSRRSVSHTQATASSPPRTLFEALRQPKIFDTTSNAYSPETAITQPRAPLFQSPEASVAPGHQGALKRQHEATHADVSHQHKRRSSLKGKAPAAAVGGSFKRSVHFEEEDSLSQESLVSSVDKKSKGLTKKRVMDEQTEPQLEEQGPSTKVPKVSTDEEYVPFKFSVYKAENRPMPKLPILEKLEEKLARAQALCEPKRLTEEQLQYIEEARLKRARQVDEDEIALSRARILAEKLRTGPGIFDGWTGKIREPWHDPNWNPIARIAEKYHARKIPQPTSYVPPRLTLNRTARGYEVAYAPDTPDRPMSRTEQRIRRTGARGLANVPLDFERHRREKEEMAKSKNGKKETGGKDKKDEEKKDKSSKSV